MRIERRYTKVGDTPPTVGLNFRYTTSEIRNPDGSVVFKLEHVLRRRNSSRRSPRRAGAEVFPQGRRACPAEEGRRELGPLLPVALGRRRGGAGDAAGEGALRRRAVLQAGVPPSGWVLDLLGLEGRLLLVALRAPGVSRRGLLHAGGADGGARTRRSGSTPVCSGPTASTARARATITSTSRPAS